MASSETLSLVLAGKSYSVPKKRLVDLTLFSDDQSLLLAPYAIKSGVTRNDFAMFIKIIAGKNVTIKEENVEGLKSLSSEMGYARIASVLESAGFSDLSATVPKIKAKESCDQSGNESLSDVLARLSELTSEFDRVKQHMGSQKYEIDDLSLRLRKLEKNVHENDKVSGRSKDEVSVRTLRDELRTEREKRRSDCKALYERVRKIERGKVDSGDSDSVVKAQAQGKTRGRSQSEIGVRESGHGRHSQRETKSGHDKDEMENDKSEREKKRERSGRSEKKSRDSEDKVVERHVEPELTEPTNDTEGERETGKDEGTKCDDGKHGEGKQGKVDDEKEKGKEKVEPEPEPEKVEEEKKVESKEEKDEPEVAEANKEAPVKEDDGEKKEEPEKVEERVVEVIQEEVKDEKTEEERQELERIRLDEEKKEQERIRQEEEDERIRLEQLEHQRYEERRLERQKLEREWLEQQRAEREKIEQQKREQQRVEKERLDQERVKREQLEREQIQQEEATRFKGKPYYGILSFFRTKCGGNVHERGVVNVTTSSNEYFWSKPHLITDGSVEGWSSKDESLSWITFDFKSHLVCLTHYSLRCGDHGYPKKWEITGSNDGKLWTNIDSRDTSELSDKECHTYTCQSHSRFYKHIRLTHTEKNIIRSNKLSLCQIEFFGTVKPR